MTDRIKVIFTSENTTEDDTEIFYENLSNVFPEFEEISSSLEDGSFMSILEADASEFDDDTLDAIRKLTHHAECLYCETGMEYVHVDVIED